MAYSYTYESTTIPIQTAQGCHWFQKYYGTLSSVTFVPGTVRVCTRTCPATSTPEDEKDIKPIISGMILLVTNLWKHVLIKFTNSGYVYRGLLSSTLLRQRWTNRAYGDPNGKSVVEAYLGILWQSSYLEKESSGFILYSSDYVFVCSTGSTFCPSSKRISLSHHRDERYWLRLNNAHWNRI